jgi:hypothetical protein
MQALSARNNAPGIGSHYILISGPTGVHGPATRTARE